MTIKKEDFGDDFSWGVSTAAYQIEGGCNADGKGLSIWDTFSRKKKKIANGDHGNVSCDFYNLHTGDITLLNRLRIPNYRFSIAWSRILPAGTGQVNHAGIDFYNKVIDACLANGIEPWITLYHWELPEALQQKGGWVNRDVLAWFTEYTECCVKYFGDRVRHWIVLNEPLVFTGAGYFLGVHAPGKTGLSSFLAAAHHAALCQAQGGRILRSLQAGSHIGTTFSYSHVEPFRQCSKDIFAAKRVDALLNRMFLEPLLGMGYPTGDLKVLRHIERFMLAGDEAQLAFDMDFIGVQNYTREVVEHSYFTPYLKARIVKADERKVERTVMNWEVYPLSIYHALKRISSYPGVREIVVTENGAAFEDEVTDGLIRDDKRVAYLKDYISQMLAAKKEGAKVKGYFVWTLLDNFEWAEGYRPRFGLVHVNFETLKRTVKASGYWYRDFLSLR